MRALRVLSGLQGHGINTRPVLHFIRLFQHTVSHRTKQRVQTRISPSKPKCSELVSILCTFCGAGDRRGRGNSGD